MPDWLVYRYFPEALELDRQDFLPTDRFLALMREAGVVQVRRSFTDHCRDERLEEFLTYASDRHRASELLAISDVAYTNGLRRLESVLEAGPEVVERSDFVVRIAGDKVVGRTGGMTSACSRRRLD